jgi:site-specific recombinase
MQAHHITSFQKSATSAGSSVGQHHAVVKVRLEQNIGNLTSTLVDMQQDVQFSTTSAGERHLFGQRKANGHPKSELRYAGW